MGLFKYFKEACVLFYNYLASLQVTWISIDNNAVRLNFIRFQVLGYTNQVQKVTLDMTNTIHANVQFSHSHQTKLRMTVSVYQELQCQFHLVIENANMVSVVSSMINMVLR